MKFKCPGCNREYEYDGKKKLITGALFTPMHRNVMDEYIQEIKMFYCSDRNCENLIAILQTSPHETLYIPASVV